MMLAFFSTRGASATVTTLSLITLLALIPPITTDRTTWPKCKHGWDGRGRVLELQDDYVTTLNIEKCNITTLHIDDFNTTAPKLEEIDLSENEIEDIDPTVFIPVSHITWLMLSQNKIRNIPNFGAHALFPRLQGLHLDNNRITAINDTRIFSGCGKLEYLYLSRNQIEYIAPDVFKSLTNIESIDLSDNRMTRIIDSVFNIKSLETIWLDNNLIEYVSPNAFGSLRQLYLYRNRISFLPDNFASIFLPPPQGSIPSRTLFYGNPWQCRCLLELLAALKTAKSGVTYAAWEYNGKLPSCVFRGEPCRRHLRLH